MAYTDYNELIKDFRDIRDHGLMLIESADTNLDLDVGDYTSLGRLLERLMYFSFLVRVTLGFNELVSQMENEKDRFEVQKFQKNFIDFFGDEIDSFIRCGRSWKFEDYRCIDWEKRLVDYMLDVKETFFG